MTPTKYMRLVSRHLLKVRMRGMSNKDIAERLGAGDKRPNYVSMLINRDTTLSPERLPDLAALCLLTPNENMRLVIAYARGHALGSRALRWAVESFAGVRVRERTESIEVAPLHPPRGDNSDASSASEDPVLGPVSNEHEETEGSQLTDDAQAQKNGAPAYARSSFAVAPDILQGLPGLIDALKLRSVAQMLTMLVRHRDEVVSALVPVVASFREREGLAAEAGIKAKKALRREIDDISPEMAEKFLALLREEKAAV